MTSLNHSDVRNASVDQPSPTIMPYVNPALVTPPYLISYYGQGGDSDVSQPVPTITTKDRHALVTPSFILAHYSNAVYTEINHPMSTIVGITHHSLITAEEMLPDCGFRMLEPHELKRGMSFPDSYVILGNKRDQVRQVGNAVCCNVAEAIAQRVMESLQ